MSKVVTYFRYFLDYLKHGDFVSIIISVRYLLKGKSHNKDRLIKTSIGKFHCRKNTNDFQFANLYYEWGVKKFVLKHRNDFSVFIDGGACIGDYSILMSKFVDRCIAFEPVSFNYKALIENIKINQLSSKIKTFQIALGKENKEVSFVFNPVNGGASYITKDSLSSEHKTDQRSFDFLFPQLGIQSSDRVLFKLDVEGMELDAIIGAREFITNQASLTLIIEGTHTRGERIRKTLSELGSFEFGIVDDCNIFARKLNHQTK